MLLTLQHRRFVLSLVSVILQSTIRGEPIKKIHQCYMKSLPKSGHLNNILNIIWLPKIHPRGQCSSTLFSPWTEITGTRTLLECLFCKEISMCGQISLAWDTDTTTSLRKLSKELYKVFHTHHLLQSSHLQTFL